MWNAYTAIRSPLPLQHYIIKLRESSNWIEPRNVVLLVVETKPSAIRTTLESGQSLKLI